MYPNNDPMADYFNAPYDDFDVNAGNNPKPHEGMQIAMLTKYGPKSTQKKGNILTADLIIVQPAQGSTYAPGSVVKLGWFVNESDSTKRRYERKRSDDFITALIGLPPKTQCGQHAVQGSAPTQPWRGILIRIWGETTRDIDPKTGKPYLNFRYEHIPQGSELIVQNRAQLDKIEAQTSGLPPQHMQQAPHPSQMAQQYPAQTGAPMPQQQYGQGVPPGVPMQQSNPQPGWPANMPNPYQQQAAQLPQHPQQHQMGQGYPAAQPTQPAAPVQGMPNGFRLPGQ